MEDEKHHLHADAPSEDTTCDNTIIEANLDEEKYPRADRLSTNELLERCGAQNTNAAIKITRHNALSTVLIGRGTDLREGTSEPLQKTAELYPKAPKMSTTKSIHSDPSSPIKSDGHSAKNSDEQDSTLETTPGKTPASEKLPPRAVKTPKNTNRKLEDHPREDNLLELTNFMKEANKEVGKIQKQINTIRRHQYQLSAIVPRISRNSR